MGALALFVFGFDNEHDSFQFDQAAFTVGYQPKEGFGALVDVAAGEDMKILNASEGSNPNTFDVVQGFVQYAKGPLTVIGGKFVTLAGAEVIAPTGNSNFSRSFLFYAEPLTPTGFRATYAASDTFSLIVGVNNGWNYSSLAWNGAAFYMNYALSDQWRVSLRVGYLDDKGGFVTGTGIAQTLKEGTLTFGYDPVKSFEIRFEGRYDKSSQSSFVRTINQGGAASTYADNQTEVAVQGVYKF